MKAVVYNKYGPPEVLEFQDVPIPTPKHNEMLVKVHATSVTAGDWRMRKAEPFLVRIFGGLFRPSKVKILGFELAGVVAETGKDVKGFKKGDYVFACCGFKFGAYAEYKCLPENELVALKPANMTFEEAATVPVGGLTAIRLLRQAGIQKGHNVLIYGASGSVGSFAVQLAGYYGARVTAVCSTVNIDMVRSIRADRVIDYTKDDFTKMSDSFDIVFDAVGKTSKSACRYLLKPKGKYVSVDGMPKENPDDMLSLKAIIEEGRLRSVIDRTYTLDQIREAHAYAQTFRKKGNISIKVIPSP